MPNVEELGDRVVGLLGEGVLDGEDDDTARGLADPVDDKEVGRDAKVLRQGLPEVQLGARLASGAVHVKDIHVDLVGDRHRRKLAELAQVEGALGLRPESRRETNSVASRTPRGTHRGGGRIDTKLQEDLLHDLASVPLAVEIPDVGIRLLRPSGHDAVRGELRTDEVLICSGDAQLVEARVRAHVGVKWCSKSKTVRRDGLGRVDSRGDDGRRDVLPHILASDGNVALVGHL